MTRVGVLGAGGRMGSTVCTAVAADSDLTLVAAIDAEASGEVAGVAISDDMSAMEAAGAEVVVDFTVAAAARQNLPTVAAAGMHAVVGTTGLDEADIEMLGAAFTRSNCLIAPNFALSAVLMMRFAELAAPYFDTAEVIEYHHDAKIDAPSGTALATASRIAAASTEWAPDPTEREVVAGARGGGVEPGVRIHAVRMRGMVAHQEVIFGTAGQSLTIRQDSYDRSSFMPGVLLACKRIGDHRGLTIGLDGLLDL